MAFAIARSCLQFALCWDRALSRADALVSRDRHVILMSCRAAPAQRVAWVSNSLEARWGRTLSSFGKLDVLVLSSMWSAGRELSPGGFEKRAHPNGLDNVDDINYILSR